MSGSKYGSVGRSSFLACMLRFDHCVWHQSDLTGSALLDVFDTEEMIDATSVVDRVDDILLVVWTGQERERKQVFDSLCTGQDCQVDPKPTAARRP